MGCVAFRVEDMDEVDDVINQANAITDRPVVVDFRCVENENVFPMVAAGGSNDDVMVAPSQQAMLDQLRGATK